MKSSTKLLIIMVIAYMFIPFGVDASNGKSLYDVIKEQSVMDNIKSTFVNSNSGIDFTKASSDTNGKGVYELSSTKDDEYPVYYYRGNVTNNNVRFANFCWKIVRTTEKGGIKLIYNGAPVDGSCANSGNSIAIGVSKFNDLEDSEAYVGYMTSDLVDGVFSGNYDNTHDSTIKKVVDEWYKNNMLDYTDELEDTIFCSDRSKSVSNNNYFAIYDRIRNGTPSFECKNDVDKYTVSKENGNGALKYPVGLLTYDEDMYAGGKSQNVVAEYYLFEDGYYGAFWSMTPSCFRNGVGGNMTFSVNFSGYSSSVLQGNWRVRPVIAMKNNFLVVSGDGTETNPYVLSKKYVITTAEEYENLQIDRDYAVNGETVRLNITDSDDYEVKEVIVIDSLGNRISVDNYTFEMPEDDVTIKLVLNKKNKGINSIENPETGDSIVNYFIICIISGMIICIFLRKRKLFCR